MAEKKKKKTAKEKKAERERVQTTLLVLAMLLAAFALLAVAMALPELPAATVPTETTVLPPNPYGETDFAYDNGYLTCLAGESVLGVDVSSHQGEVDWQQVKDAGFEFVMIRVGYRGYESGQISADAMAQTNYAGARAAGLKVGAYFFSQAISEEEVLEEAAFLLDAISGWEVDMPVVFDWEYVSDTARTADMDASTLTQCALRFAEEVEQAGYRPMIYFNPHLADTWLQLEQLASYPFWLALYTDRMTFDYRVEMWQYTHDGSVPGITGNADINLWLPYE